MKKRIAIALLVVALVAVGVVAGVTLLPRLTADLKPAEVEEPADVPEEESEEQEVLSDKPAQPVTMAEAPTRTSTTDAGLTVTAPEAFLGSAELAAVEDEIAALEEDGFTVSVVLLDLETRRGVTYNADAAMYPASSIKAAFCTWLYEAKGGAGKLSSEVADAIINSDNEAYDKLTDTYGYESFESWYKDVSGFAFERPRVHYIYPHVTAGSLASVWEEIYDFGTSDEKGADELAGYLAQTTVSPIAEVLRGDVEVWSKAGWYPTDKWDIPASNDAGVVFSDTGAYVMVVMTDMSSNLGALEPLVSALDAAHTLMCGDTVAYYE